MVEMILCNVEVEAHNDVEETLIINTERAIDEFDLLTTPQLANASYNECWTRIKVLYELGIITFATYDYLTDYIFVIWKGKKKYCK